MPTLSATTSLRRRATAVATATAILLALGVTLAAPASAEPAATVTSSSTYVDSLDLRHIAGQVRNTGSVDILAPHIDLEVLDASGNVIDRPFADALVAVLAPGESAPFDTQVSAADYASHRVTGVSADPSSTPPNHNLAVTITNVFTDSNGGRLITGTVRNDNNTQADNPELVFTFLRDGVAVGGEAISTETAEPLQPGQSARFTESVNPDIPAYTTFEVLAQSSSAPSRDPAAPPPSSTPPPAATPLNCNPALRLSTSSIVTGQAVTVSVTGTPGSTVTLEGYSRPSTTYLPIRRDVELDGSGTAPSFVVRPATNARIRLQVRGCSTPGTGQVITVTPVLTIAVARTGTRTYLFSGKILPAAQNTGRAITLYYQPPTGSPVRKGIAVTAANGTYAVKLSFSRTATLRFYYATGANQTNNAAKSAVRTLTTS